MRHETNLPAGLVLGEESLEEETLPAGLILGQEEKPSIPLKISAQQSQQTQPIEGLDTFEFGDTGTATLPTISKKQVTIPPQDHQAYEEGFALSIAEPSTTAVALPQLLLPRDMADVPKPPKSPLMFATGQPITPELKEAKEYWQQKTEKIEDLPYILKAGYNQSLIGTTQEVLSGEKSFSIEDYEPNTLEEIGAIATGFFLDIPFFAVTGGAGGIVTKATIQQGVKMAGKQAVTQLVKKEVPRETAERIVRAGMQKNATKIAKFTGMAEASGASGTALGSYGAMHEGLRQMAEEDKSFSELDFKEIAKEGLIGATLGVGLGATGAGFGLAGTAIKQSGMSAAQKTASLIGLKTAGFGAEVSIFTLGDKALRGEDLSSISKEDWEKSVKMVLGAKIAHIPSMARKYLKSKEKAPEIELNAEETKLVEEAKKITDEELIEKLKDANIPLTTKDKVLYAARGIYPEANQEIRSIKITTEEGKSVINIFNKEGLLLDKKQYAGKGHAENEAFRLMDLVKENELFEKIESLSVEQKYELRDQLDTEELKGALTNPNRTPEQKKLIKQTIETIDKLLVPEEKPIEPEAKPEVGVEAAEKERLAKEAKGKEPEKPEVPPKEQPITKTTYDFETARPEIQERFEYFTKEVEGKTEYFKREKPTKAEKPPEVKTQKIITRQDLKNNPNVQYLFGDNLQKTGLGGQAKEMRDEPNAIGIPTKKKPSNTSDSFFTDTEFEQNKKTIDDAFSKIDKNKSIVIPEDGLGTGLADLPNKAPKTYEYLQKRLQELKMPKVKAPTEERLKEIPSELKPLTQEARTPIYTDRFGKMIVRKFGDYEKEGNLFIDLREKVKPPEKEPETPQFKEHITIGTKAQKGKYQVEKVGNDIKILNVDSGKYVKKTKQNQWAIDQYVDANIEALRSGKKAEIPEGIQPNEVNKYVAENSKNPEEIATAWINSKETRDPSTITFEEAVYEAAWNIDPTSFKDIAGYGTKDVPHLLNRFKKGGKSLDAIAEQVNETMNIAEERTGAIAEELKTKESETTQRIVDVLISKEFKDYRPKKETQNEIDLAGKFKEITGLDLTEFTAKKVTDYRATLEKWADQIKEFKENLPDVAVPFFIAPRLLKYALGIVENALRAGSTLTRAIKLAIIKTKELMKRENTPKDQFDEDQFKNIMRGKTDIFAGIKPGRTFEREEGKKSILGRAFESRMAGEKPEVKRAIETHELTYQKESHEQAKASSENLLKDIGFDKALELVRDNKVEGGAASFIWGAIIDDVGKRRDATKDPAEITRLTDMGAQLLNEFDKKYRGMGQQLSALNPVYELYDFQYNLSKQIEKYKSANDGIIPAEVEAKFREYDKQLKELNIKLKKAEEKLLTAENEKTIRDIKEALDRDKKQPTRERIIKEASKKLAERIRKGKLSRPDVFSAATPGSLVWDGAMEIAAKTIETGGTIAQAVVDGISHIKASKWYKNLTSEKQNEAEKAYRDYFKDKEKTTEGKIKIPHILIRDFVERGIDNIRDLTKSVQEAIKEEYPEATEREVRDAITEYGKTANLNKEEIETKIRKMKRMGRTISGIEDVRNKKRPLRSGLQRDKLDAEERALQKELKELMKDLPPEEGQLEKEWKSALDAIKARLRNSIEDLGRRIETGEKPLPKKVVEYDLEAKELKTERDRLKKVVEDIEGKPEMTDEQKVKMAIRSEERRIADYERKIREKELETPPKKPIPQTPELKALKAQKEILKGELQKLQETAGIPEKKRLEQTKKRIQKSMDDLTERIKTQNFAPRPKKPPIRPDDELIKLKAEKDKIKEQYDLEHEKLKLQQRSTTQKIWDNAVDLVMNFPKTMRSTLDMSAPFRQGVVNAMRPSQWKTTSASFKTMFQHAFSEKKADDWLRYIKASPEYSLMKSSGLFLAEPNAKLIAREEVYRSNLADKIPVYKYLHKASQRAYTGFLNKQRVDTFLNFANKLIKEGHDPLKEPQLFKAWADFVNNATGRGNLGKFEMAAEKLNNFFFSPRLIAARFNLINPIKYAKMPKETRKEVLLSMFEFIGTGMGILMTAAINDDVEVELDPRSSDFGKMRIGNIRIDIWGGFVQWVRLIAQLATGQRKSTETGEITVLGEGYGSQSRSDVLVNFFKYKLSPTTATALSLAEGKNPIGQDIDAIDELTNLAIPLYLDDVDELLKEEGLGVPGTVGLIGLAFFGIGIQQHETYTKTSVERIMEKRSKPKEEKTEEEKEATKAKAKEEELKKAAEKYGIKYVPPKAPKKKQSEFSYGF